MRSAVFSFCLLVLCAAAPKPKTPSVTASVPVASATDLAEQLTMLAFDANPLWSIPPRTVLSRWAGPMRMFVFGRPEDRADAQAAARSLASPTRLSIRVVAERDIVRAQPNAFLVADEDLAGAFRGPLRAMLANAFLDNEAAVDGFIADVIATTPCWTLPVWTDATRRVLKATVIGVDITQPRELSRACIIRGLGAAIGLLGPGAYLPASAFAPGGPAKLSRDDDRMLRTLFGPALRPGMTREKTQETARQAFAASAPKKRPKTQ